MLRCSISYWFSIFSSINFRFDCLFGILDVNRTAAVTMLSKEHSDRFSEVMNETNDRMEVARMYIL